MPFELTQGILTGFLCWGIANVIIYVITYYTTK